MKNIINVFVALLLVSQTFSQPMSFELNSGYRYSLYQHAIKGKLASAPRFSIFHIANLLMWYNDDLAKNGNTNELMNQGYVGYNFNSHLSLLGGYFYTNKTGANASLALQYFTKGKIWMLLVVPRIDIKKKGNFELFLKQEFRPELSRKLKLYSYLQTMFNYGSDGFNRGYQRIRVGLDFYTLQLGVALNLDEYGKKMLLKKDVGLFIRKEIF